MNQPDRDSDRPLWIAMAVIYALAAIVTALDIFVWRS